jgi:hypothetical protein
MVWTQLCACTLIGVWHLKTTQLYAIFQISDGLGFQALEDGMVRTKYFQKGMQTVPPLLYLLWLPFVNLSKESIILVIYLW